ncbi:MAG: ABC transporter substrate-binding protein, partial [SAR324 cluster bacterium]
MKKLIAVAVVAMMMLGTSVSANEWNKIRIGVEGAYPPFSEVAPDGTLKGFDIDIA